MEQDWIALTDRTPPEPCPPVIVTNNVSARDAHGFPSHVWLTSFVHKSANGEFVTFDEADRKIHGLTHWRPAFR